MLTHMLRQTPAQQPMKDIMDRAIAAEKRSATVLNASVFGGFPLADIPYVGLAIVVVADRRKLAAGQKLVEELTQIGVVAPRRVRLPLRADGSVGRPREDPARGPGRSWSTTATTAAQAAPTDDMRVLEEVIRQDLDDVVAGPFWDPESVAQMIETGRRKPDHAQARGQDRHAAARTRRRTARGHRPRARGSPTAITP